MQILEEPLTVPGEVFEEREIPSDESLVTPTVVRLVSRLLEEKCIDAESKVKIELCLDEAITNGIKHGNKADFSKIVEIVLWRNDDEWGVAIRDEGEGFSMSDITQGMDPEAVWGESGRGLALLTLYMDDVTYFEKGSALLLRKRF